MSTEFIGAKIALYFGDKLVVYLRDDKPGLPFANMWDFPGGGRGGNETPLECVTREVEEEFSIRLNPQSIVWKREYPAQLDPTKKAYFFVGKIEQADFDAIKFGDEGQKWQLMSPEEFISRDDAAPRIKERLQDYLDIVSR